MAVAVARRTDDPMGMDSIRAAMTSGRWAIDACANWLAEGDQLGYRWANRNKFTVARAP